MNQFVALRYLNYFVYNAYVLHRCINVEPLLKAGKGKGKDAQSVLESFHRTWKQISIRGFVANINRAIAADGTATLIPDMFKVGDGGGVDEVAEEVNLTAADKRPWPKRNRRKLTDVEPWVSQRLSKAWPHEMRYGDKKRACVACTMFENERPVKRVKTSAFVCSGCDNVSLCTKPPKDSRRKSCWTRWHSNKTINS